MVTPRKSAPTPKTPPNPNHHQIDENGRTQAKETTEKASGYEQFKEERIKANLERLQKLGILDLSLKLKSIKFARKSSSSSNRKIPPRLSPLPPPGLLRRSSRLQNVTPVRYSEVNPRKKNTSLESECDLLREDSKPEVYTEEHEKLLGNTEMSWTLFVDGCGLDGRRIYDPIKGKTCHQCRQKTLGHRTHCSNCDMIQGQFCGDCLYMRYGEHVLEAKQNPNWICPVCRGICNCSLCRHAEGWPPTGPLYTKISQLGFKSVAHYLIQTRRRSQIDADKIPGTSIPASAKRSLHFSDMEATSEGKESPMSNNDHHRLVTPKYEDNKTDDEFKCERMEEMHFPENEHGVSNIASGFSQDPNKKFALTSESNKKFALTSESNYYHQELSEPESEDNKTDEKSEGKNGEKIHFLDYKHIDNNVAQEISPRSKRKSHTPEPTPDSVAGRLRQRRCKGNGHHVELIGTEEGLDVKQAAKDMPSRSAAKGKINRSSSTTTRVDSIAGRLRLRRKSTT